MLEKNSKKAIAAVALAALTLASFQLSGTPAYSEEQDSFGVEKIYPTAAGGNEWYVNMDDPRDDPNFRNLGNVQFSENPDGSWRVSADQIRMEAWSPSDEKWLNVEITEYAKIESGSNELLQMYSRGGHHTNRDQCFGSAYKARLYGDGEAAWNKEVTHPAYAGNRGTTTATIESLEDRWIGFKAVIYNFVEDGNTYVRLESYIDDNVTDADGNLVVKNDWKLASVYEDRGDWATNNSDFNSSCKPMNKDSTQQYRQRDEIINLPGGTNTQNIAAWRSDDLTWSFKYLSVREIDPLAQQAPEEEPVENPSPSEEPALPEEQTAGADSICCILVTTQHVPNDGNITAVNSVDLDMKKVLYRTAGIITVAIVQDDEVLGTYEMTTSVLQTSYRNVKATFNDVNVADDFDIVVMFEGSGIVAGSITAIN
ncbi:MAG TPA: hypothetical protein VJ742_00240 [Nitrososphaera sp.]|nr:hypothetical protein [Nitrososphaera sp.]